MDRALAQGQPHAQLGRVGGEAAGLGHDHAALRGVPAIHEEDPLHLRGAGIQPLHIQDEALEGAVKDPLLNAHRHLAAGHVEDQVLEGLVAVGQDPDGDDEGEERRGNAEKDRRPAEPAEAGAGPSEAQELAVGAQACECGKGGQENRHGNGYDQGIREDVEEELEDRQHPHALVDNQFDQAEDLVGQEDEGEDHEAEQKGCGHLLQYGTIQEPHRCPQRSLGTNRANCTPASEGDIAVFPADAADAVPEAVPPPSTRIGPLVPLAVVFGLGIAAAPALPLGPAGWVAAALLGLALAAVGPWVRLRRLRWPALAAGFFCLGAHAVVVAERGAPPHHVSRLPEAALVASLAVEGWVARPPDPQPPDTRDTHDTQRTRFVAEVTHLTLEGRRVPATGRARLTVLGPPVDVRYGDEVRGTFRLRHPRRFDNPGAFDYPAYLASQGVFLEGWTREPVEVTRASRGSRLLAGIFGVRTLLLQRLDAAMPPPQAGLLKATVLGDRSGLTPEMNRAFLDSGTYHILAISGLNVSLLAGALFGLFRLLRASPRWAAGAAAVLVTFYAALAGAGASVIRAAVMADVYLLAVVLDRRADLLNSLALSGLAILWWNPRFLHDAGFQLTYLATLGIILVLPRFQSRLVSLPRPLRWILESVAITVAATAATLPILAGSFNRVSPAGLLANIPIVPLSGLITGLGTAACAVFLAVPTGLAWLNQVNGWLVDALLALARWFGAWPWSTVRVYAPTTGMLLCYYGALAAALWAWPVRLRPGGRGRFSRSAGWVSLGCCALLAAQILWRLYPAVEDSRVRLTMLDVGQGEAIYLEVPGRSNMLVDAGGHARRRLRHRPARHRPVPMARMGEAVGCRGPDAPAVGSHRRRADHSPGGYGRGGLDGRLAGRLRDGRVDSGIPPPPAHPTSGGCRRGSAPSLGARRRAGHSPRRGGPRARRPSASGREPGPNDRSVVLRVQSGDQAILLTGDLERSGEAVLLGSGATLAAQVLKVPHHGSRQSSTEAFLRAVGPAVGYGLRRPPQSVPAPPPGNRGPIPGGGHSCLADGSKWCDQRGDAARGDTGPGPAGRSDERAPGAGHRDRQEATERSQRAAALVEDLFLYPPAERPALEPPRDLVSGRGSLCFLSVPPRP